MRTQALFKGKDKVATKKVAPKPPAPKKAAPPPKRSAPPKKAPAPPKPAPKKVAPPPKKAAPAPKKVAPPPKKAAPAPVKKAVPKPAPRKASPPPPTRKPAPKVVSKPRAAGQSGTAGWFGEAGGAANLDKWYGPSRSLYLPRGLLDPSEMSPALTGELAGDYGFDPLGLGKDKETIDKYRANELIHARWAMLGTAGAFIPEGLAANGANIKSATWFETGAGMLDGGTLNYFAVPWGIISNPLPLAAIVVFEVALMGAVENYRRSGKGPQGYAPGVGKFESSAFDGLDPLYPGGPLDPFNLARDPEIFQELKVKEIKNGRLAMVSFLGYAVQAAVTGEGPYANWEIGRAHV